LRQFIAKSPKAPKARQGFGDSTLFGNAIGGQIVRAIGGLNRTGPLVLACLTIELNQPRGIMPLTTFRWIAFGVLLALILATAFGGISGAG